MFTHKSESTHLRFYCQSDGVLKVTFNSEVILSRKRR